MLFCVIYSFLEFAKNRGALNLISGLCKKKFEKKMERDEMLQSFMDVTGVDLKFASTFLEASDSQP